MKAEKTESERERQKGGRSANQENTKRIMMDRGDEVVKVRQAQG